MKIFFIMISALFFILAIPCLISFSKANAAIKLKSSLVTVVFYGVLFALRLFLLWIPYYILFLVLAALGADIFIGYYLDWYRKSRVFDRFLHALGAFSFSLLFYYILGGFIDYGGSRLFLSLYVFILGIALGAIYEIIEFISDIKNGSHMQKGLRDTNFDTVFNMAGSASAAVFAFFVIL